MFHHLPESRKNKLPHLRRTDLVSIMGFPASFVRLVTRDVTLGFENGDTEQKSTTRIPYIPVDSLMLLRIARVEKPSI